MKNADIMAASSTSGKLLRATCLMGASLLVIAALSMQYANAQDPMAVPQALPVTEANGMPAPAAPVDVTAQPVPQDPTAMIAAQPVPATPAMPTPAPAAGNNTINMQSTPSDLPEGAPSSLAGVIKDLQKSNENISVDDMARAEDALARLELLVQIEQKIGELKKAKEDQMTDSGNMQFGGMPGMPAGQIAGAAGQMASAIPASALSLPAGAMPASATMARPSHSDTFASSSSSSFKVEQVSGANGNFSAVMVDPDGERKIVRIGDKVGKQEVTNIGADGVQLRGAKGSTKTIAVENNGFAMTPFAR